MTKAESEILGEIDNDTFIVINRKRFQELNEASKCTKSGGYFQSSVLKLEWAVNNFVKNYEEITGKKLDQKYLVCNQDEPYANKVAALILGVKPRWETPEQWEKRTGKPWPDKWPVFFEYGENTNNWHIDKYIKVKRQRVLKICRICVFTEDGPPPDDWEPEDNANTSGK